MTIILFIIDISRPCGLIVVLRLLQILPFNRFLTIISRSYGRFINHRAECRVLPKLQPQGGSRTEDTDPGMAASVQLEQTSAGHFGGVDSGSDRDTAGHSVCNSGWTSGSGAYATRVFLRARTCRVQTSHRVNDVSGPKLSLGIHREFSTKLIERPRDIPANRSQLIEVCDPNVQFSWTKIQVCGKVIEKIPSTSVFAFLCVMCNYFAK